MVNRSKTKRSRKILEVPGETFQSVSPNLITSWSLPFNKEFILDHPNSAEFVWNWKLN